MDLAVHLVALMVVQLVFNFYLHTYGIIMDTILPVLVTNTPAHEKKHKKNVIISSISLNFEDGTYTRSIKSI